MTDHTFVCIWSLGEDAEEAAEEEAAAEVEECNTKGLMAALSQLFCKMASLKAYNCFADVNNKSIGVTPPPPPPPLLPMVVVAVLALTSFKFSISVFNKCVCTRPLWMKKCPNSSEKVKDKVNKMHESKKSAQIKEQSFTCPTTRWILVAPPRLRRLRHHCHHCHHCHHWWSVEMNRALAWPSTNVGWRRAGTKHDEDERFH